ncbi:hypothetical protein ES703_56578 [subsurface metagenome]
MAIVSIALEEVALVVIVLVGLPELGIEVPLGVLIAVMVAWGVFSVFIYQMGSRALKRKPIAGLSDMVGSKGKVVRPLAPQGLVRIKGELWEAESVDDSIGIGEKVIVVGQDALKLMVRKGETDHLEITR